MTLERSRLPLLFAAGVVLAGISGCWAQPAAESVLEGTWQLIPSESSNPLLTNCLLTFDRNGDLAQVSYTFAGNATVTWNDPQASVSVDGDALHISSTQSGNGLVFDGTLDSTTAPTSAAGTLSSNLVVGGVTVSVSQGSATLFKQ